MQGHGCRLDPSAIAPTTSSIDGGIAVQQFFPVSAAWCSNAVIRARNRREIADHQNDVVGRAALSDQADHARFGILAIDSFDARWINVPLMEGGFLAVGAIEIGDPLLHAAMQREI